MHRVKHGTICRLIVNFEGFCKAQMAFLDWMRLDGVFVFHSTVKEYHAIPHHKDVTFESVSLSFEVAELDAFKRGIVNRQTFSRKFFTTIGQNYISLLQLYISDSQ